MKKRLLSLALVLTMMCSLFTAMSVSAASMFSDINGHWAQATIEELASKGIINGKGAGLYDPEGKVTRAEFAKLLVCTVEDSFSSEYGSLLDVPEDAWFNPYVYEALKQGVFYVNELNGGYFLPNEAADRETVAVWAVRLLGVEGDSSSTPFVDNSNIDNKVAVATAYSEGIITGDAGTNKFRPDDSLTRAEAATIIKRVISKYQEKNTLRPSKNTVDYNDEVAKFESNTNINVLISEDDENGIYVFDKIDDKIKNLKVGDLFIIEPCETIPEGIAIKVKEIEISGSKATIWQGDIALEEIVDEIDISAETVIDFENITELALADGVTAVDENGKTFAMVKSEMKNHVYLADNSDKHASSHIGSSKTSVSKSISFKISENQKVTGTISVSNPVLTTDVDYHALSGLKKLEVKVTETAGANIKYQCEGSIGAKASSFTVGNNNGFTDLINTFETNKNRDETQKYQQKLAEMDIPVGTTGLIATIGMFAEIEASGEITVSFNTSVKTTFGFSYKDGKVSKISEKTVERELSADAEGKIKAGVGVEAELSFLKVISVSCGADAGLGAKASTKIINKGTSTQYDRVENTTSTTETTGKLSITHNSSGVDEMEIHPCPICFDGDIYFYMDLEAKAEIGVGKWKITPVKISTSIFDEKNAKLADFYISIGYKNPVEFDFGECPHVIKKPSVYEQPKNVSVEEGQTVRLYTIGRNSAFKDDEIIKWESDSTFDTGLGYQWYKDGSPIDIDARREILIQDAKETDSGEYFCRIYLESYNQMYIDTKKVKVEVKKVGEEIIEEKEEERAEIAVVTKTGSVSENKNSSFTFTPPTTGTYHFKNTQGSVVVMNIDGEYKSNEGYYELTGGYTYTVNVEWGYEDTNYAIQIKGPITY